MTAAIANRGFYYIPHIVKSIAKQEEISPEYVLKHSISIDSVHFETVIKGMEAAVNGGEGATARIASIDSIIVCGKTGTAQNPHGEDHSVFIAFAPKDNPKIALAVYVENAGFGATYAAPIASLLIEKYLKGDISLNNKWKEQYINNLNLTDTIPENETAR
jgi:penicillin-binding protein 2